MTILTLIALFLSLTALLTGTCALFVALRSSDRALRKQLSELSLRFSDYETALESFQGRLKSMGVQIRNKERAKSPSVDEPETTFGQTEREKDEWQRQMNRQLHAQRFKT